MVDFATENYQEHFSQPLKPTMDSLGSIGDSIQLIFLKQAENYLPLNSKSSNCFEFYSSGFHLSGDCRFF